MGLAVPAGIPARGVADRCGGPLADHVGEGVRQLGAHQPDGLRRGVRAPDARQHAGVERSPGPEPRAAVGRAARDRGRPRRVVGRRSRLALATGVRTPRSATSGDRPSLLRRPERGADRGGPRLRTWHREVTVVGLRSVRYDGPWPRRASGRGCASHESRRPAPNCTQPTGGHAVRTATRRTGPDQWRARPSAPPSRDTGRLRRRGGRARRRGRVRRHADRSREGSHRVRAGRDRNA